MDDADDCASLRDVIEGLRIQLRAADKVNFERAGEITLLKEQLAIARTSAKDSDEFREREKKHAEAVMTGMRLAIMAMAGGLK